MLETQKQKNCCSTACGNKTAMYWLSEFQEKKKKKIRIKIMDNLSLDEAELLSQILKDMGYISKVFNDICPICFTNVSTKNFYVQIKRISCTFVLLSTLKKLFKL